MKTNKIKDYFLGKLSSAEAEALEIEIIAEAEIEAEVEIAESNLIEDYLEKTLSQSDQTAFEQNYLITKERRGQVEIVRQLKIYSQKKSVIERQPNFFEQLKAWLSLRPITLAFAALALILGVGIGWQLLFSNAQTGIETELVAINRQDLSNLEEFKGINNLNLMTGKLRSDGGSTTLNKTSLTERILLRLAFPAKIDSPKTFNVKISQNGKNLFNFKQVSYQTQEVRVLLPKSILTKGEYQIMLENSGENYNYYFAVQ